MATEEQFYSLFGRLAVKFASLDYVTTIIVQHLLSGPDLVAACVVTHRMGLGRKIQLARQLAHYRFAANAKKADLLDLLRDVESISVRRNEYIHGRWSVNPDLISAGKVCVDKARTLHVAESTKYLEFGMRVNEEKPLSELKQLAEEIEAVEARATKFFVGLEANDMLHIPWSIFRQPTRADTNEKRCDGENHQ